MNYTYGDSNWKDKLTAYNGTTISYDAIGNPLTDGTWTYTWQAGRQLKQMAKSDKTVEFMYNHEGLRVKKTVGTVTTLYTLHGKNIVHLTHGSSDWMHFFYDASGKVASVNYNGQRYAYLYNMQGDVVGLLDSTGAEVVKYTYDAWGKQLSKTGSLANTLGTIQPFRYRGYVYDDETGLYYLRSRYYNPTWGRFVNADNMIFGNIFAYCSPSPVSQYDPTGHSAVNINRGFHFVEGGSCTQKHVVPLNYKVDPDIGNINKALEPLAIYFEEKFTWGALVNKTMELSAAHMAGRFTTVGLSVGGFGGAVIGMLGGGAVAFIMILAGKAMENQIDGKWAMTEKEASEMLFSSLNSAVFSSLPDSDKKSLKLLYNRLERWIDRFIEKMNEDEPYAIY